MVPQSCCDTACPLILTSSSPMRSFISSAHVPFCVLLPADSSPPLQKISKRESTHGGLNQRGQNDQCMSNAPSLRPTLHPAQPTSCQGDPCPNTLLQGTSLGSTARTKSKDQHVVWRFRCACFVLFRPQKKCKARMAKLQARDMPRDIFESWSDNYGRSSCALMRKTSCTPRYLDLVKWKGS